MLFLCYTLCFNSVSCYFNSVAMHMFDGNARMYSSSQKKTTHNKKKNSAGISFIGIDNEGTALIRDYIIYILGMRDVTPLGRTTTKNDRGAEQVYLPIIFSSVFYTRRTSPCCVVVSMNVLRTTISNVFQ